MPTNNLTEHNKEVADAIRAKKGTSEKINPQDFAKEISNLPSGKFVEKAIEGMLLYDGDRYDLPQGEGIYFLGIEPSDPLSSRNEVIFNIGGSDSPFYIPNPDGVLDHSWYIFNEPSGSCVVFYNNDAGGCEFHSYGSHVESITAGPSSSGNYYFYGIEWILS